VEYKNIFVTVVLYHCETYSLSSYGKKIDCVIQEDAEENISTYDRKSNMESEKMA
jgi:hypothetical protein